MKILPDITETPRDRLQRIVRSYVSAFNDLDVAYAVYADRSRYPMSPDDFHAVVQSLPPEEPAAEPTATEKVAEILANHGVGSGMYGQSHLLYLKTVAASVVKALA